MFEELGGLFGWMLIAAFAGTILNYILKFVNKNFNKSINASEYGKKIMKLLMTIFVRNHKYFGFATMVFLLVHFTIQFSEYGINVTGLIAAVIMVFEVGLGIYANVKKKPRKGVWFFLHHMFAVLLILGIALHLIAPYAFKIVKEKDNISKDTTTGTSDLQMYTLDELSNYDGQNGNRAYVAYKGLVYDVTDIEEWSDGEHHGQNAGTDLTDALSNSPHEDSIFQSVKIVGKIN